MLISGDHVLGRISLFFDYGWTPDPVGEFLRSLDEVEALEPGWRCRVTASRSSTFTATSRATAGWWPSASRPLWRRCADEPLTAFEVAPPVYGEALTQRTPAGG